MREVYAGQRHILTKHFYFDGSPQIANNVVMHLVNEEAEQVGTYYAVENLNDGSFEVDFYAPREDGIYVLLWFYDDVNLIAQTDEERLSVVTPYVNIEELRTFNPELEIRTDRELMEKERIVRAVINSYCRQSFGRQRKTVNIYGNWRSLELPERMFRLERVTAGGVNVTHQFAYNVNNPYILMNPSVGGIPTFYDIKSDTWYGRTAYGGGTRVAFQVRGWFGWEDVPSEVNLAAKLLVRDYFLDEARWREAGVDVLRAADWRIEYAQNPATTTGNVNVDMMLEKYRDLRLMFI